MKKILSIFTILLYLFTSSTLVHSFCAKAHLDESIYAHSCCDGDEDEWSRDCFDNCMSSFSDTVSPVLEFTKKTSSDIDFGLKYSLLEDILFLHTEKYFLTEFVHDPPRQLNYVWVVKIIE